MEKIKFTPEAPYVLYWPEHVHAQWRATIAEWLDHCGGVAVWYAADLSMAGSSTLTPAHDRTPYEYVHRVSENVTTNRPDDMSEWEAHYEPTKCPGWQWDRAPSAIITDPACIRVEKLLVSDTITRTYMDLDLFAMAAERAHARIVVRLGDGAGGDAALCDVHEVEYHPWVLNYGSRLLSRTLIIYASREAYDGSGYRCGTEEYRAELPMVRRNTESEMIRVQAKMSLAAQWLVQIDDSAMVALLTSAPDESVIVDAWQHPDTRDVVTDENLCEGDDAWVVGVTIDDEFMSLKDYEQCSLYYKPDDEFIHNEMCAVLRQILEVGVHREYIRGDGCWGVFDARHERMV